MHVRADAYLEFLCNTVQHNGTARDSVVEFHMYISAALALTLCVCALQASAQQTLPSQLNAIVLNLCLPEENLATRAVDPVITNTLSGIASQLIGGACKSIP